VYLTSSDEPTRQAATTEKTTCCRLRTKPRGTWNQHRSRPGLAKHRRHDGAGTEEPGEELGAGASTEQRGCAVGQTGTRLLRGERRHQLSSGGSRSSRRSLLRPTMDDAAVCVQGRHRSEWALLNHGLSWTLRERANVRRKGQPQVGEARLWLSP
jgi:hypothetical protein